MAEARAPARAAGGRARTRAARPRERRQGPGRAGSPRGPERSGSGGVRSNSNLLPVIPSASSGGRSGSEAGASSDAVAGGRELRDGRVDRRARVRGLFDEHLVGGRLHFRRPRRLGLGCRCPGRCRCRRRQRELERHLGNRRFADDQASAGTSTTTTAMLSGPPAAFARSTRRRTDSAGGCPPSASLNVFSGTDPCRPSEQSRKRSPGRASTAAISTDTSGAWPIARVSSWRRGWFSASSALSTPISIHSATIEWSRVSGSSAPSRSR